MKLAFTFFLSLMVLVNQDLSEIREKYVLASKTKKSAEDFFDMMSNTSKENQVLYAYKGASIALKAKFAKEVKLKKSLFIEGVKLLESTIKNDPSNLELRVIRISIQENTPKILNYKSAISEDKKLLLSNFSKQNQSLKEYIRNYINQSNLFTDKEKKSILN